jgi:hypothetical protein
MTATKAAPKADPALEGLLWISEIPGANLPVETCRWPPALQAANMLLLHLLGELCYAREPSGIGGYSPRGTPETWRRLRDVDESAITERLLRVEAAHPSWRLDGGAGATLIDKIDCHFATAQVRRRRGWE